MAVVIVIVNGFIVLVLVFGSLVRLLLFEQALQFGPKDIRTTPLQVSGQHGDQFIDVGILSVKRPPDLRMKNYSRVFPVKVIHKSEWTQDG
jgi:hypothetical protein